jgi:hypothetical protein
MVDALPYDILYRIAQFLSPRDVSGLAAVNRQLRDAVGLDAKFGEIKLDRHDSRMKGICEMLRLVCLLLCCEEAMLTPVTYLLCIFIYPMRSVASF